jgi:hypothetical protein
MKRSLALILMILLCLFLNAQDIQKCRVIILTDIENEPDDTEAGSYKKPVHFDQAENLYRIPYIKAPVVDKPETVHFILKVTDKGNPPLTRYKRVIVNFIP